MVEPRTLVIKLGASGDVVRTTVLLHVLEGVTWVTRRANVPLLPEHPSLMRVMDLDEAAARLPGESFDRVICLDDEPEAAALAAAVQAGELVGTYRDAYGRVAYSDSAAGWFDMGLISRHGRERADALKAANRLTVQQHLFRMIDREFQGEEYLLRTDGVPAPDPGLVALESRAGERWPTKQWHRYDDLAAALEAAGLGVRRLAQRGTMAEYIADIGSCGYMVTGDTLGLHLALAQGVRTVGIFTCTSPDEIHGYGRLAKVVSPRLDEAFYRTEYVPAAVESITLEAVLEALRSLGCPLPA